jgi:hypothetical protein
MYKFPQVWKTTIALDQRLPFGSGTVEGIYSTNINETAYYNANFENPVGTINGPDVDLCSQEMIMVLVLIIMLPMR